MLGSFLKVFNKTFNIYQVVAIRWLFYFVIEL